jgi:hypothetical protein
MCKRLIVPGSLFSFSELAAMPELACRASLRAALLSCG